MHHLNGQNSNTSPPGHRPTPSRPPVVRSPITNSVQLSLSPLADHFKHWVEIYSVSVCTSTGVSASTLRCPPSAQSQQLTTSWCIWWTDGSRCSPIATGVNLVRFVDNFPSTGH